MSVREVSESGEYKKLIGEGGAVVVDFSATWCGPCRRVEPVFKELAKSNKSIKFVRVDIDEASETMPNELQGISGVPTFKFYYDGKQIDTFSGANLNRLRENVEKLKKKLAESEAAKSDDQDAGATSSEKNTESEDENKVAHVSTNQEFTKIISSGKVVVDFSASWCFPCKMIAPTFEELAKDNKDIKFVKIDIDEAAEELEDVLAGIIGVPTFFYYADGEVVDRMSGANVRTLKEKLRQLASRESKKPEEKKKEEEAPKKPENDECCKGGVCEKAAEKKEDDDDSCCGGGVCGKKKTEDVAVEETRESPKKEEEDKKSEDDKTDNVSIERSDPQPEPEQKTESVAVGSDEQKEQNKVEEPATSSSSDNDVTMEQEQTVKEEETVKDQTVVEDTATTASEEKNGDDHQKSD